jgi:hypothetical protein
MRGAVSDSHGDHRVAMALAVAGMAASGETTVTNTDCIRTSFPDFEPLLKSVGDPGRRGKNRRKLLIAIDGPAGSGKSTAARELARRLGYLYMDTGALYRAVGWKALQERLDLTNEAAIGRMIRHLNLKVRPEPNRLHVSIGNRDITNQLRAPEVSRTATAVAAMPVVRQRLLGLQRELGHGGGVVMEGRDIGTAVKSGFSGGFRSSGSRTKRSTSTRHGRRSMSGIKGIRGGPSPRSGGRRMRS